MVAGIGAIAGGVDQGVKSYQSGGSFGQVTGACGRGFVAGGVATLVGVVAAEATGNIYAGGAVGSAINDIVNQALGGKEVALPEFAGDMLAGAGFAGAAEEFGPAVHGGSNFNPWTSPRTFGPKAMQAYASEAIADALGIWKGLLHLAGRKDMSNER